MFDMVENRSLAKSLKYWAYSYSKSNKLSQENTQPENICHIVFEKKKRLWWDSKQNECYAEAAVQRVL